MTNIKVGDRVRCTLGESVIVGVVKADGEAWQCKNGRWRLVGEEFSHVPSWLSDNYGPLRAIYTPEVPS